ncbi:MAG: class I SAM-dependent methyltransferase [Gemmatimonadota bacterium]|nr:class I SAM-dependent methyltransferase [Gemmatimonadota bacterium]
MNTSEAVALIEAAVPRGGATWADVGAGDGTFTRALVALLGREARIYAVDRDARAVASLRRWAARAGANVIPLEADFARPLELPEVLDGLLAANALHFVRDADVVLARLAALVRPGGRVVLIEYDRRAASRWVPYPISSDRLPKLATSAGLSTPMITATRPSAFGGILYVAAADRVG